MFIWERLLSLVVARTVQLSLGTSKSTQPPVLSLPSRAYVYRGLPLPPGVGAPICPFIHKKKGYPFPRTGKRIPLKKAKKRGLPRLSALAVF
ncbi:recombinase [Dehalococcoides mccartyi VS]|uniref:Recombinase n=1 Tax=Dehalococcoides mccartyi (strain VS) TaxID=311424 RepID=D2BGG1_DEHMV|nr:recombinase [Dehalococcoides mccartyi VS]